MTSFHVHSASSAPSGSRALLERAQESYGFLPNLFGVLAASPAVLAGYVALSEQFAATTLSATEQQVVLLSASAVNGCEYCVAAHTTVAGMHAVAEEIVEALRLGAPLADPRLQALREFTAEIVEKRGWLAEEDTKAFLSAGYTDLNVLEVLLGVSLKTLSNYTNHLAETPLDGAFQPQAWSRPEAVSDAF